MRQKYERGDVKFKSKQHESSSTALFWGWTSDDVIDVRVLLHSWPAREAVTFDAHALGIDLPLGI